MGKLKEERKNEETGQRKIGQRLPTGECGVNEQTPMDMRRTKITVDCQSRLTIYGGKPLTEVSVQKYRNFKELQFLGRPVYKKLICGLLL